MVVLGSTCKSSLKSSYTFTTEDFTLYNMRPFNLGPRSGWIEHCMKNRATFGCEHGKKTQDCPRKSWIQSSESSSHKTLHRESNMNKCVYLVDYFVTWSPYFHCLSCKCHNERLNNWCRDNFPQLKNPSLCFWINLQTNKNRLPGSNFIVSMAPEATRHQ